MFKKKLSGAAYRRKRNIKSKEAEKYSNRLKKYRDQNNNCCEEIPETTWNGESFEAVCGQDFGDSLPLKANCGEDLGDPGRGVFCGFEEGRTIP